MQAFRLYLSIVNFLCLISSYYSLEINRLQARAFAHAPQTISSAAKAGEASGRAPELAHLHTAIDPSFATSTGSHVLDTSSNMNPLDNAHNTPSLFEKGSNVGGVDEHMTLQHPNPSATDPPKQVQQSMFTTIFQKMKVWGKNFVNALKNMRYAYRAIKMEPLRHSEVVRFQNGRTMIGKYLALGEHKLDATPGQALDLKALAKTLDERFPFLVGKENGAPGNMLSHESYLKYLKQYQLMLDDNNAAKKGWTFEIQAEKLADHDQTVAEISKSLKEMQEPGIKESFKKQSDQIITRISEATGGKIIGI
ncbi:hypothetical protein PGTUg99_033779 [Puccinia graminis f. sp. tritici]|uniref:Uncharacterized protein n=1 Tax=Puccinia graminis f. sp. tritici TaxID=56615 RepID=A0A5B0RFT5_PUCGR|nr:hypothetical protein PGTUg99_033779 [Puccinia graminis f. sp. tritici]